MANAQQLLVERQLRRVHRRMLLQSMLNAMLWCWLAGLLLNCVWLLVQPYMYAEPPRWLAGTITGSLVGLGTAAGILIGYLRGPSRLTAALSLDSEFGLKERVTTSLTLEESLKNTPAGQALLADVHDKIQKLDIGSHFRIRLTWTAAMVPCAALLLALLAIFYEPGQGTARAATKDPATAAPENVADIDQKMKELQKRPPREKDKEPRLKDEQLEKLEAEMEKIANRPRVTKDEVRERVKEMTALEESMKGREKEMAEKARALKSQLSKMQQKDSDGPAKELEKALSEGKMDKAKEAVDRLTEKMKSNQLSAKEMEQLKKQLEKMKDKLESLAKQKDKEEQLKKANLDPETLAREMKELKKQNEGMKGLEDLAKQLGEAQKALKEGDMDAARENLSKAGDKMKEMGGEEEDLQDLRDQLRALQDAKDSC